MGKQGEIRQVDTDLLRILAAFFVIVIHVSASQSIGLSSLCYNAIARFSVPVFVMISGQYMLSRLPAYSHIAKKSVRLLSVLLLWSSVYTVFDVVYRGVHFRGWQELLSYILLHPIHFWYLYAAIALYLFTPCLSLFCKQASRTDLRYAMILTFLFGSVIWTLLKTPYVPVLAEIIEKMKVDVTLGFVFCYLFGYGVVTYGLERRVRGLLYCLGIVGFCVTFGGTLFFSHRDAALNELLFRFFTPNVLLSSMAVFVLLKYGTKRLHLSEKAEMLIHKLSDCTFGIYLLHLLPLQMLQQLVPALQELPGVWGIPLQAGGLFVATALLVFGLRKIPFLHRML